VGSGLKDGPSLLHRGALMEVVKSASIGIRLLLHATRSYIPDAFVFRGFDLWPEKSAENISSHLLSLDPNVLASSLHALSMLPLDSINDATVTHSKYSHADLIATVVDFMRNALIFSSSSGGSVVKDVCKEYFLGNLLQWLSSAPIVATMETKIKLAQILGICCMYADANFIGNLVHILLP